MTDADLLDALRDCYDTNLRRNLVDGQLVRSAELTLDTEAPGYRIPNVPPRYLARVTLRASSADEALTAQLRAQVENRLLGLPAISRVELTMLPALFAILS